MRWSGSSRCSPISDHRHWPPTDQDSRPLNGPQANELGTVRDSIGPVYRKTLGEMRRTLLVLWIDDPLHIKKNRRLSTDSGIGLVGNET